MFRQHWFKPGFWRWWWGHRASPTAKAVPAVLAILAIAVGGYFAAGGLGAVFAPGTEIAFYETTVRSVQTMRENGTTVRRVVPVVQRVVVTTTERPDGVRVVTRRVITTVPVVRRQVVTIAGAARTLVETTPGGVVTRTVPGSNRTVTNERVITDRQVLTDRHVVTSERTVTTDRSVTVVQPVTQTITTSRKTSVTLQTTTTVTQPVTTTQTTTVTLPVTVTVTVTTKKDGLPDLP